MQFAGGQADDFLPPPLEISGPASFILTVDPLTGEVHEGRRLSQFDEVESGGEEDGVEAEAGIFDGYVVAEEKVEDRRLSMGMGMG